MYKYKDPAFLFYPESFLVGVAYMTDEEVGQYIKLMCYQHQKGHIPESIMEKQEPAVQEKFKRDKDGKYFNERLEHEIECRQRFVDARRENGMLGGRPRKDDKLGSIEDWAKEILPESIQEAFLEFSELRESMGSPIQTKGSVRRLYEKLQTLEKREDRQKKVIEQSIDNGWKNFYRLNEEEKRPYYKELPTARDSREENVEYLKGAPDEVMEKWGKMMKGEQN